MKIGFCGTMSVGKTTLVQALQNSGKFPDYEFITERSKYLNELGIPLNTDSTLKGQVIFLAERCAELICENIITDRTIIDVIAFTSLSPSISYIDKTAFIALADSVVKEYDYIFYISPEGIPIEDNGVRTIDPEYRDEIDKHIKSLIEVHNFPLGKINTISGTTEERMSQVINIIGL